MSSTSEPVLVGLADSGVGGAPADKVAGARAFGLDVAGKVCEAEAPDTDAGHGSELAGIILQAAPGANLLDARIFPRGRATTPVVAAAGIDWLVARGARVINMSFGLSADRDAMRLACENAVAQGVVMLAASPARGAAVFPASYDGVIRVSGDARCGPGEFSHLASAQADFGACPRPPGTTPGDPGGASFAVAYACGAVAAFLAASPAADRARATAHLKALCRYEGPERRGPAKGFK